MSSDLLLTGGTLVTPSESTQADLLIRRGRIAAIGRDLQADCDRRDVTGLWVMPGGIDTHVHLEHPIDRLGVVTADDFYTGTVAAACGGTTSIIDFALQRKGETIEQAVTRRMEEAGKSVVDYGLHVILTDVRDDVLEEIPRFIAEGYVSFKIYTTFGDKYVDDAGLLRVLEKTAAHGGLVYVHCENDAAIRYFTLACIECGETGPPGHMKSRPPEAEAEAVSRVIALAEMVRAPLCIAHVTSRRALESIQTARTRGVPVFAETCPQYLTLTDEQYAVDRGFEAAKYVCTPPLRAREHQQALWRGLSHGDLQQVSSDHSSFRFKDQRQVGRGDFTRIPNGLPGIETRLSILFSEGVCQGRLSASRFVDLVAAQPAKIFGLYPQKGTISVGSDADLVVLDPDAEWVVDYRSLHQAVDYSPYDGMTLKGTPVLTLLRGQVVSEGRQPRVERGQGRFLARHLRV